MKRRLATALAAALLLFAATDGAFNAAAQAPEAAARKATKPVQRSCPLHPEIKARSAGKCPKCRVQQRKMKSAREKNDRGNPNQAQPTADADANQ